MGPSTCKQAADLAENIRANEFSDVPSDNMVEAWRIMKEELVTNGDASEAFTLALEALAG